MKIAVYGTLKKGQALSYLMKTAKFIQEDYVMGQLYNFAKYYPHISLTPPKPKKVTVEVYEVDNELLEKLDRVEAGYKRTPTATTGGLNVELYEMPRIPTEDDTQYERDSFPFN
jgi:gamma-glutamylcyclotransferase (GGCT)/AIG2-like uncharacterized protein YtfP